MIDAASNGMTETSGAGVQARTLDGMVPAENVVYVVGSNVPGYLPESAGTAYSSAADALDALRDEADHTLDGLAQVEFDTTGSDAESSTCCDLAYLDSMRADRDDLAALQAHGHIDVRIGEDFSSTDYVGVVVFVHARSVDALGLDADALQSLAWDGVAYLDA